MRQTTEVEVRKWELFRSGVGTVEACRLTGVARKTVYRWRAEVGNVVLDRLADALRSIRYLSMVKRQRIAGPHRQGLALPTREIAQRLERSPSMVSRELRRSTAALGHAMRGFTKRPIVVLMAG